MKKRIKMVNINWTEESEIWLKGTYERKLATTTTNTIKL
jgi:hypothetical protein